MKLAFVGVLCLLPGLVCVSDAADMSRNVPRTTPQGDFPVVSGQASAPAIIARSESPTSRIRTLSWLNTIQWRSAIFGSLWLEIKDMKLSVIEEQTPQGNTITKYYMSGTDAVTAQDDKGNTSWKFTITIYNSANAPIDSLEFGLPAYPCHYDHWAWPPPPQPSPIVSRYNYFDVIHHAEMTSGSWDRDYTGGC